MKQTLAELFSDINIIIKMGIQSLKLNFYFIILIILSSCNNDNKSLEEESYFAKANLKEFAAYKILKTEPFESSYKAQVICYAYLTTDTISKSKLEGTLNKIYLSLRKYKNFNNYSSPTSISVYLYTSREKAINLQESWIAMLSKSPSENQPIISFDDFKLTAHESNERNRKSADDLLFEKMNRLFKKQNTDICTIYKILYDIEGQTIKQADKKYPDFGVEHLEYQEKLYKQESKNLLNKYAINDSLLPYINVFGSKYCK